MTRDLPPLVIDYTIDYISTAYLKISLKVCSLFLLLSLYLVILFLCRVTIDQKKFSLGTCTRKY